MDATTGKFLLSRFPFDGLSPKESEKLLFALQPQTENFARGDVVPTIRDSAGAIGFVLSGELEVVKERTGKEDHLSMKLLSSGDSFGILSLFSDAEKAPTVIRARSATTVLYLTTRDVDLLLAVPAVAKNFCRFLAGRVRFLGERIASLGESSAEDKLRTHLRGEYKKADGKPFFFNGKLTAETLGIGRASLYRALDKLSVDGILSVENKILTVYAPERL